MIMLSREHAREIDRLAIEEVGIPGIVLMENAGRQAAEAVLGVLRDRHGIDPEDGRVVIVCGGGNNGGDGYVIARHLHNWGVCVSVYTAKDPDSLKGDAAVNHAICVKMGLAISSITDMQSLTEQAVGWSKVHVIVDALLGTGFSGEVRGHLGAVIERINGVEEASVVAVDVPSGLDCDTGRPSCTTVRADLTVTFLASKKGFAQDSAEGFLGRVVVADIGAPPELIGRVVG